MTTLTKEEIAKLPPYTAVNSPTQSAAVQHLKVLSTAGNTVRVIAAVPGSVGYGHAPDGTLITFEYSAISHFNHAVTDPAIVDLNHHTDEIIGHISKTETDSEGQLINDITIDDKYSFYVPIMLGNLHDGVSIESNITSGVWLSDTRVLVTGYTLTGIAVLFAKPPACDKEICRVLSSEVVDKEHLAIHDLLVKIDGMTDDEIVDSYNKVIVEIAAREEATKTASTV